MSDDQINGAAGGSEAAAAVQRTRGHRQRDCLLCVQVREARVCVCVALARRCVLLCRFHVSVCVCMVQRAFDQRALLITKLVC